MLWFTVWALLVLGTLAGAFFLLRDVYRKGMALLAELGRASDVVAELADRADELAANGTQPAPVDLVDTEPARARLRLAQQASAARRARRAERHAAAQRRWASFSH